MFRKTRNIRLLRRGPPRRLVVVIIIVVVVVVRAPLRPVDVLDELAAVRRAPERVRALGEHELRDDRARDDDAKIATGFPAPDPSDFNR